MCDGHLVTSFKSSYLIFKSCFSTPSDGRKLLPGCIPPGLIGRSSLSRSTHLL